MATTEQTLSTQCYIGHHAVIDPTGQPSGCGGHTGGMACECRCHAPTELDDLVLIAGHHFTPTAFRSSHVGAEAPTRAACGCGWTAPDIDSCRPAAHRRWGAHRHEIPGMAAALLRQSIATADPTS